MNTALLAISLIAFFAMIFGIVYIRVTARHRKEMAMIESGMNPMNHPRKKQSKTRIIRTALLFLVIPPGLFIGNYYADTHGFENSDVTGVMVAFMFGGVALIAHYFIDKYIEKKSSSS